MAKPSKFKVDAAREEEEGEEELEAVASTASPGDDEAGDKECLPALMETLTSGLHSSCNASLYPSRRYPLPSLDLSSIWIEC